jgi:hypothetical protein
MQSCNFHKLCNFLNFINYYSWHYTFYMIYVLYNTSVSFEISNNQHSCEHFLDLFDQPDDNHRD